LAVRVREERWDGFTGQLSWAVWAAPKREGKERKVGWARREERR